MKCFCIAYLNIDLSGNPCLLLGIEGQPEPLNYGELLYPNERINTRERDF